MKFSLGNTFLKSIIADLRNSTDTTALERNPPKKPFDKSTRRSKFFDNLGEQPEAMSPFAGQTDKRHLQRPPRIITSSNQPEIAPLEVTDGIASPKKENAWFQHENAWSQKENARPQKQHAPIRELTVRATDEEFLPKTPKRVTLPGPNKTMKNADPNNRFSALSQHLADDNEPAPSRDPESPPMAISRRSSVRRTANVPTTQTSPTAISPSPLRNVAVPTTPPQVGSEFPALPNTAKAKVAIKEPHPPANLSPTQAAALGSPREQRLNNAPRGKNTTPMSYAKIAQMKLGNS